MKFPVSSLELGVTLRQGAFCHEVVDVVVVLNLIGSLEDRAEVVPSRHDRKERDEQPADRPFATFSQPAGSILCGWRFGISGGFCHAMLAAGARLRRLCGRQD